MFYPFFRVGFPSNAKVRPRLTIPMCAGAHSEIRVDPAESSYISAGAGLVEERRRLIADCQALAWSDGFGDHWPVKTRTFSPSDVPKYESGTGTSFRN